MEVGLRHKQTHTKQKAKKKVIKESK